MGAFRCQVLFGADSDEPKHRFNINPVFNSVLGTPTYQDVANDLAVDLTNWTNSSRSVRVKIYELGGPPPHPPKADVEFNNTLFPASQAPRELALCLSFYNDYNVKRRRGRLYIPAALIGGATGRTATQLQVDKAKALVPIFTDLGQADMDWSIWSKTDQTARKVTNWWINDEWDVIRSRGWVESFRDEGTTSEQSRLVPRLMGGAIVEDLPGVLLYVAPATAAAIAGVVYYWLRHRS